MHKLSIIIPAYNAEPYIEELIQRLKPQIRDDIEVLVVDDGSKFPYLPPYDWVRVIRQDNKGLAGARNTGIENTDGEYIHFIDADDLVPENYVEYVLNKIKTEQFDYMELSWKSLPGSSLNYDFHLRSVNDILTNPSACTRIYKRTFIGKLRFNERKRATEDEDFYRRMEFSKGKKSVAEEYMYFYRTDTPNSLSKQYLNGALKTKRIVYYYKHITKGMEWLIDEVKEADQENEVFILTEYNEIPELAKYAQISRPHGMRAHELRGEETNIVEILKNIETQVVIYMSAPEEFGGRETFIFNFCKHMSKHYDIIVVFDRVQSSFQVKLMKYVRVIVNSRKTSISCDTIIVNSVYDVIPQNIVYKQSIQMVHGCKTSTARTLPTDKNITVCVSEAVKDSFGDEAKNAVVIRNLTSGEKPTKIRSEGEKLKLITASRLNTDPRYEDKGASRMIQLARMLEEKGIEYEWGYFAERPLRNTPRGMIYHEPVSNIKDYIAEADYLVQLSSAEAFCYSVVEALEIGTAVIVHYLPVFKELKIKDGQNGYILPMDMNFDINMLKKIPTFKYSYNNGTLVSKWKKVLGNTKPKHDYVPVPMALVKFRIRCKDSQDGRYYRPGEEAWFVKERAEAVVKNNLGIIVVEV